MGKSPVVAKRELVSPPRADAQKSADQSAAVKPDGAAATTTTTSHSRPDLPPPTRKSTSSQHAPDYFSASHTSNQGALSSEANPFERSFAGGAGPGPGAGAAATESTGGLQTPGGTKLPSVHALTSPAGMLGAGTTPNFWGGLRSGPLSPAMLSGPQKEDYFSESHHLGRSYTPNESSLRTGLTPGGDSSFMRSGLTPGGGGSMFPEPSPNSIFNPLQGGGATPGTVEFRNTALNAMKAQPRSSDAHGGPVPKSAGPPPTSAAPNGVAKPPLNTLDSHDNDAANGLFLLSHGRPQGQSQYPPPPLPAHAHAQPSHSNSTSPIDRHHRTAGHDSLSGASARAHSVGSGYSDDHDAQKGPTTRNRGKRGSGQTNGRRKADEPAAKPPAKKAKGNSGIAMPLTEPEPPSEEELDMSKEEYNANGKKMTDEEKRKNFLERNRVAALKCRQRKKQWLANLQQKVEIFSSENENLNAQIAHLREELVNLKTLLLAHKDCPVSQQQGISGMQMQAVMDGGFSSQMNPYGMAAINHAMAGQGMQEARNFS